MDADMLYSIGTEPTRLVSVPIGGGMRLHYHNLHSLLVNRHWHIVKRHITIRKLANALSCLVHYWMRREIVASRPLYVKVETTDCCNLRCEHCHDGTVTRRNDFLDFSMYTSVIDQYSRYLLEVSLFDQGEPLLDPLIVDYVRYASSCNIGTVISTNLSMTLSDEQLSQLVTSGLDYIQVAIDGVTQATYEQYRVGGDLDLVLFNLRRLIATRRRLGSRTPLIEWQMLDFAFNRAEQERASELAAELGADRFMIKPDSHSALLSPAGYSRQVKCILLWVSFAVESDGAVSACLVKDGDSLYVGDLRETSIQDIWNSPAFAKLRRCSGRACSEHPCRECNWFAGRAKTSPENRATTAR